MSERTSYHHGDLRSALLDAAQRLIARDGVAAFTLRACAREAGVSHAAPAHHFGDVRGLLTALATQAAQTLGQAMAVTNRDEVPAGALVAHRESLLPPDASLAVSEPAASYQLAHRPSQQHVRQPVPQHAQQHAQQRLQAIGLAYVNFALQYPGLFELLFRADLIDNTAPGLQRAQQALLDQLDGAMSALFAATETFDQPIVPRIVLLWSFVHGLSSLLLGGNFQQYRGGASPADFARAMLAEGTRMLWPGLMSQQTTVMHAPMAAEGLVPMSAGAEPAVMPAGSGVGSEPASATTLLAPMQVKELKRR